MRRVLVVDDSKVDRVLVEGLLAVPGQIEVECACDGADALERIGARQPDLVVTDLVMPGTDGLALTIEVRRRFPHVPVVLMTAQGSEEVAVAALQAGAASYVPKSVLAADLRDTVERILSISRIDGAGARPLDTVVASEATYVLPNDPALIRLLVKHLQDCSRIVGLGDDATNMQIGVALQEALINAAHHGNLEVSSELRASDVDAHRAMLSKRAREAPYCLRCVHVTARFSADEARFTIRDEGPGFDPSSLPDPREAPNLFRPSGRGVLLMRAFMDSVEYNEQGNEVTLVKRR